MLELIRQFRWRDLIDIGIITFLIYRSLQIVRGSRAMQMIMGLAVILGRLCLVARSWAVHAQLDSRQLSWLDHSGYHRHFQSDIRRALTQVGSAPLFVTAERMIQRHEDIIEEIAQAAMSLAAKHVGALIVLQREVGLNEYMEIGTRLDARVSRELVESVFLPHSPIHDGALVIQKGRVTAVRCLLPLSTNPNLRKTWGTRHRAALGVTEETDAVAVVISEQESTVALVVGGNVTENIDGGQAAIGVARLGQIMKRLWEKIVSLAGSNFGLKALALIIAVGLWLAGHRDTERAIEVAVEFRNLPSDLMVMDNRVDYVVLRLMGPRTLVSTLDADDLKLALDLNGAKSGASSYTSGRRFQCAARRRRRQNHAPGDSSATGASGQTHPAGDGAALRQTGRRLPSHANGGAAGERFGARTGGRCAASRGSRDPAARCRRKPKRNQTSTFGCRTITSR